MSNRTMRTRSRVYGKTSKSSSPQSSIQAIAARIQGQATQLAEQRTALAAAKRELERELGAREKSYILKDETRHKLLKEMYARVGMELELYDIRDKIKHHTEANARILQEREEVLEETKNVRENWEVMVRDVYSPHMLEMDSYRRLIDGAIQGKNERLSGHKRRMDETKENIETIAEQILTIEREKKGIESEISFVDQEANGADDDECDYSARTKADLAERSNLRQELQKAQKEYDEAHAKMVRCERECT